ncbi:MAG: hypothetical protein ACTH6N_02850 [Brachybacterium tyrofermentans]|uniref:hypothetical protein n=1 Tax=Brachybacterium tyrofermentans TaxID=47848 RepID=UPI00299F910B|nr:hypothetical protein [Brachybacterium tyrofermentans]
MAIGSAVGTGRRAAPETAPGAQQTGQFVGHLHLDETISPVVRTDFDVAAYAKRGTERIVVDSSQRAADGPLPAELRTTLGVLHRLEASALAESRAMLATSTGHEARITAFFATWLVERFWQSRALRDVLAGGDPASVTDAADTSEHRSALHPLHALRRVHVDRVQPLLSPLWGIVTGEGVTAGHMARMAIQEASLQAALVAVSRQLDGEAQRVVDRVAERHDAAVGFFTAEAITRITRSRGEAISARAVLALSSPLHGGGLADAQLITALRVIGADTRDRAALRRARFEITRLLPGPDLAGGLPFPRPLKGA